MIERLSRRLASSVLLWDVLLTLLALKGAATVRLWLEFGNTISNEQAFVPWQLYGLVAVIWTVVFLLLTPQRALFFSLLTEAVGRLLAAVALAMLAFAGVLYFSFRDISRLQIIYFAVLDLTVLLLLHLVVRLYFRWRTQHRHQRRTLVVGDAQQAQQLVHEFERRPWVGVHIVGCATNHLIDNSSLQILGTVSETAYLVEQFRIDEVIFVALDQREIAEISIQLAKHSVMLHMVPSILDLAFARIPVETLGGIPLLSLRESALSDPQRLLKRMFDFTGSALLILLFSPLMALIALAVKLESPGPIFFLQERVGEQGRRFRMIKFRSMYHNAEHRWTEVSQRDESGRIVHKRTDDPRITRVGKKLRRTSLDELPQLFNVLRGEMSLVGPRPEMPYIAMEYEPWQWQRFRIPPGMTGWWQINGRSEKLMHLHTEDDLYYIQNYSFWLDMKILWRTVSVVLKGRGAF